MRPAAWAWRLLCSASLLAACAHPEDDLEMADDAAPPVHHGGGGGTSSGKGGKSASGGTAVAHGGDGLIDTPLAGSTGKGGSGGNAGNAGIGGKSAGGGAGGKGSGGAGGTAGSPGSAGVANTGGAPAAGSLEVDYKCGSSPTDNQIRSSLRIKSSADGSVAVSNLELRYYFTSEVALPLTIEIYDASVDGTSGYHAISHDAVKAEVTGTDGYLKLTFTPAAGALTKGNAFTLDVAVHGPNWTGNFSEADDYSFAADHTDFAPWDHVTLFGGGELVWGKEP